MRIMISAPTPRKLAVSHCGEEGHSSSTSRQALRQALSSEPTRHQIRDEARMNPSMDLFSVWCGGGSGGGGYGGSRACTYGRAYVAERGRCSRFAASRAGALPLSGLCLCLELSPSPRRRLIPRCSPRASLADVASHACGVRFRDRTGTTRRKCTRRRAPITTVRRCRWCPRRCVFESLLRRGVRAR